MMRRIVSWAAALCASLCLLLGLPVQAQTPITISLESPSLDLKTGQEYEINIWLDNAAEVWLVNAEIAYDPSLLYIMGTKSGQPVTQGPLFDANQSVLIRNAVQGNQLIYTLSMVSPGQPVSGSGIIGTFRIYPIAPGDVQLTFTRVTLNKVTQVVDDAGTPVDTKTENLDFVPAMVQLKITGNPVEIPSEATPTPGPTETPFFAPADLPTLEPTLLNVTAGPRPQMTATPMPNQTLTTETPASSWDMLPVIAIGLMAVAVIGLGALFAVSRRSRR